METAIEFGKWILKSNYIKGDGEYWRRKGTDRFINTAQLYYAFSKTKT